MLVKIALIANQIKSRIVARALQIEFCSQRLFEFSHLSLLKPVEFLTMGGIAQENILDPNK